MSCLYNSGLREEKGLHLKAVEASGLRHLDLLHEALDQVFVDDAVGSREESEDVRDEVLLLLLQLGPVRQVLGEVDLFCRPEGGLRLLVHLPNGVVLDGQDDEPSRVLLEEWFVHFEGLELLADLAADGRGLLDRGLDDGVGLHRGLVRSVSRVLFVLGQVKVADLDEGHLGVNVFTVSGQKKSFESR